MLKRPPLNPRPTASPVSTSGAAACIVFVRARAAFAGSIEIANVTELPLTSRNEKPVAPCSRLS
jgi:hypothetical protein